MAGKRMVACTSTGCLEYAPEKYREYGIEILRVHMHFKGKEFLEGLDLNPEEFYEELETLEDPKNNLPYTSMPTTEEINALYFGANYKRFSACGVFAFIHALAHAIFEIC